ncbi:MAG: hypothetical protein AAF985_23925, partial [Bacteroidota bacterium]
MKTKPILTILLLGGFQLLAQPKYPNLPAATALHHSLDSFYLLKTQAQLAELQLQTKGNWLKYLPTLGLTYTPTGKPRPSIGWSSNLLYTSQKKRQDHESKSRSIVLQNELAHQADRIRLDGLLRKWTYLLDDIDAHQQQLQLDSLIFDIEQQKYDHHQSLPSEFLKAKKAYLQKVHALRARKREMMELKNHILETA